MPLRDRVRGVAPISEASVRAAKAGGARRPIVSALSYGLFGFVLGAIFWHFVGFWDFVGQVMFKSRTGDTEIAQASAPPKLKDRVSDVTALAVMPEPHSCSTLQLDRDTGITSMAPCEATPLPLRSVSAAKRDDRWVCAEQRNHQAAARGWSAIRIEPAGSKPVEQASVD